MGKGVEVIEMAVALIREDRDGTHVIRVFEGEEGEALQRALQFAEDYIRENGDRDEIEIAEIVDTLKHQYVERRNGYTYVPPVEITDEVYLSLLPAPAEVVGQDPKTMRETAWANAKKIAEKVLKIQIPENDREKVGDMLIDEWINFDYVWGDEYPSYIPARFIIGKDGKVWVDPEYDDAFPLSEFMKYVENRDIYVDPITFWEAMIELDNFFKGLMEGE